MSWSPTWFVRTIADSVAGSIADLCELYEIGAPQQKSSHDGPAWASRTWFVVGEI